MNIRNEEIVAEWLKVKSTKEEKENGISIFGEYEILPPYVDHEVAMAAKRNYLLSVHRKSVEVRIIDMPVMFVTGIDEQYVRQRNMFLSIARSSFSIPDNIEKPTIEPIQELEPTKTIDEIKINLHIGKLIEKVEFVVPSTSTEEERERLQEKCLNLECKLKQKLIEMLPSFLESVSSALHEDSNSLKEHH